MGATGTTTVNFGSFPGTSHTTATVTGQAGIVSGSLVEAWIRPEATADHTADEHIVETIRVVAADIVAGTGFTIHAINTSVTLASATCVAFSHDQQRTYKTLTGQLVNWDVAALAWNHERVRRLARWAEIQRRTRVLRWSNTSSLVLVVDLHGAQSQYVRQDIMDALMPYYTGWTQT